jgi:hypothetical protein
MKKKLFGLMLALAVFGAGSVSFAGFRYSPSTSVVKNEDRSGWFSGSLEAASGSSDGAQYIDCYVGATAASTYLVCEASDANNNWASCYSTDPSLVQSARSVGIATNLLVFFDGSGTCTEILVDQSSYNLIR